MDNQYTILTLIITNFPPHHAYYYLTTYATTTPYDVNTTPLSVHTL